MLWCQVILVILPACGSVAGIVYEYLKDHCDARQPMFLTYSSLLGYKRSTNILQTCSMLVQTSDARWPHIQLRFRELDLVKSPGCNVNSLKIVDAETGENITPPEGVCDKIPPMFLYRSGGSKVNVELLVGVLGWSRMGDFEIHLTAFNYPAQVNGTCAADSFQCRTGPRDSRGLRGLPGRMSSICIPRQLLCDGHNDCGDHADERLVSCRWPRVVWHLVVVLLAAFFLLIALVVVCCYCCLRKRPRPSRTVVVGGGGHHQYTPINSSSMYSPAGYVPYYGSGYNVSPTK